MNVGNSNVRPGINIDGNGKVVSVDHPKLGNITKGNLAQKKQSKKNANIQNKPFKAIVDTPLLSPSFSELQ